MGVSLYRSCRCFLVECSQAFVDHALSYVKGYEVEIIVTKMYTDTGNILVTHTWHQTLYWVSKIHAGNRLVLIDISPSLYDRLPMENVKRNIINKVLTSKLILKSITHRYRKAVSLAKIHVSISDLQEKVIKRYFGLEPSFVSYPPIDNRFFNYTHSKRNAIMIFGSIANNVEIIQSILEADTLGVIEEIISINSPNDMDELPYSGRKLTILRHYSFLDIKECYNRTFLSITSENRGAFELNPVESIMSGVPIISPIVPSLLIVDVIFKQASVELSNAKPYYDYFKVLNLTRDNAEKIKGLEVLSISDSQREKFYKFLKDVFSIDSVAKDFVAKVETKLNSQYH
jgi:hypothetical protein